MLRLQFLNGFPLESVNIWNFTNSVMHVGVDVVGQMQGCNCNCAFCDSGCYSPLHISCHHSSALLIRGGVKVGGSLLEWSEFLL